jgi:hypothetical protein
MGRKIFQFGRPSPTLNVLRLVRASVTFPGLPLLRGSSDVVRAVIAEATIACQNIASAVAIFKRAISAIPIHTIFANRDHCTPRSRGALRVSWTEAYRCKSSGSHQNRAYHHLSTSRQGLVITPRRLSLFQIAQFLRASPAADVSCSSKSDITPFSLIQYLIQSEL